MLKSAEQKIIHSSGMSVFFSRSFYVLSIQRVCIKNLFCSIVNFVLEEFGSIKEKLNYI